MLIFSLNEAPSTSRLLSVARAFRSTAASEKLPHVPGEPIERSGFSISLLSFIRNHFLEHPFFNSIKGDPKTHYVIRRCFPQIPLNIPYRLYHIILCQDQYEVAYWALCSLACCDRSFYCIFLTITYYTSLFVLTFEWSSQLWAKRECFS